MKTVSHRNYWIIRKNISVSYDGFSVSFENLRFVLPSLPEYIMNSNYVD